MQGGVQNAARPMPYPPNNADMQPTPSIPAPVVAQAQPPISTVQLPVINITAQ